MISNIIKKRQDEKYSGSYEQVAKLIYSVTSNKMDSIKAFYKTVVMNYLLKNGDAHLKNFGILYDKELKNIYFAPAYDIVNTVVYIYKDRPALSMFGKKLWHGKKELVKFGTDSCHLSSKEAKKLYESCIDALKVSIQELEAYLINNKEFRSVGSKMLDTWCYSLEQITHKELPLAITRNWAEDKRA